MIVQIPKMKNKADFYKSLIGKYELERTWLLKSDFLNKHRLDYIDSKIEEFENKLNELNKG